MIGNQAKRNPTHGAIPIRSQRLVLAVVLALASFGAPTAVMATLVNADSTPVAACTSGEEEGRTPRRACRSWCPTRRRVSPRPRPIPTSRRLTASRAPVTTAVLASGWQKNNRTWVRSRFHARPCSSARSARRRMLLAVDALLEAATLRWAEEGDVEGRAMRRSGRQRWRGTRRRGRRRRGLMRNAMPRVDGVGGDVDGAF